MASLQALWPAALLALAQLLPACAAQPTQPPIVPDRREYIAHYVTTISPDDFRAQRRIHPPNTQSKAKRDLSLWRHAYPSTFHNYNVSTCPYIIVIPSAAQALAQARAINATSYMYTLHLDHRSIDIRESFGPYTHRFEDRFAILGDLLLEQVQGWRTVDAQGYYSRLVLNLDYEWDETYSTETDYGGAPQLAGFPKNHAAWNEEPWKNFKCTFHPPEDPTLPPQQQTCYPNEAYMREFADFPEGLLDRMRRNDIKGDDCEHALDLLSGILSRLNRRIPIFADQDTCQHVKSMMATLGCGALKDMKASLKFGNEDYGGTYDIIKYVIGALDANTKVKVAQYTWPNERKEASVDLSHGMKSGPVGLADIQWINITDAQPPSGPGGDGWLCESVMLTATCSGSGRTATYKKDLNKWLKRPSDYYTPDLLEDKQIESIRLRPHQWKIESKISLKERPVDELSPLPQLGDECWDGVRQWRRCMEYAFLED